MTHAANLELKLTVLVNRYFTPFAVLLIGMGLVLSQPTPAVMAGCLGLLVFSGAFNTVLTRSAKSRGRVSKSAAAVRLYVNLAVNVLLVYILGGWWTPTWLLFVLTPCATALYGTRRKTATMAGVVSFLLLATHAARGLHAPVDWGKAVVQALFIVFFSLFLNELSGIVRRPAGRA